MASAAAPAAVPWRLLLPAMALLTFALVLPVGMLFANSVREFDPFRGALSALTLEHYGAVGKDWFVSEVMLRTIRISALTAATCVLVGYPAAYYFVYYAKRSRALILICVLAPLMVSALVRTYGWLIILGRGGPLESVLQSAGIISGPLRMLQTEAAVVVGMAHLFLAFVFLSIVAALLNIDSNVKRAARILGANELRVFCYVTLPLSLPGVLAGAVVVFSLSAGAFVTPAILGGSRVRVMSFSIWEQFGVLHNLPFGAVLAILLMCVVAVVVYGSSRLLGTRAV